ncbi:MAG: aquaporin, partial [Pirellulales bacterium]|nr:aquaporin [Pirellulales bacterium]
MSKYVRAILAEFVGTFTLVLVGTAVATLQGGWLPGYGDTGWLGISLAFGGTLMVLVLVIGPVSGCHINPAVTLPMLLSRRLPARHAAGYFLAQLLGATAASLALLALLSGLANYDVAEHGLGANGNPREMALTALFAWELLLTTLFVYTIFAAARADAPPGFAALAIGGFLFVAHLVGAQLGDSSLNPARSFGPALVQALMGRTEALRLLWIFVAAPLLGGVLGWKL